jgi:hypothetical protein
MRISRLYHHSLPSFKIIAIPDHRRRVVTTTGQHEVDIDHAGAEAGLVDLQISTRFARKRVGRLRSSGKVRRWLWNTERQCFT